MINEKLYKISIQSIMQNITLDGAAIIFDDSGMAFVEIHPADAVEVVRCKDCKHATTNERHPNKPLICGLTRMCGTTPPEWYCADGERKDNG